MRLALLAPAVLALLAVVAVASRGGFARGGSGGGVPSHTLLSYAFTLVAILYVLAIPFAIWAYVVQRRESRAAPRRRSQGRLLASLLAFVALAALAALILGARHSGGIRPKLQLPKAPNGQGRQRPGTQARSQEPEFEWPVLAAVGALAAAGVAVWLVRRRRRAPAAERSLRAELTVALDDAIDDVEAESDPRRAVIKAYARMERILAAHGLPRRPAEAPYEYLERSLTAVDASGASAARLTELYERARFSPHEIAQAMRSDAIGALTAVRDELREAEVAA